MSSSFFKSGDEAVTFIGGENGGTRWTDDSLTAIMKVHNQEQKENIMSSMVVCPLGARCLTGNTQHKKGSQSLENCLAASNGRISGATASSSDISSEFVSEVVEEKTSIFSKENHIMKFINNLDDIQLHYLDDDGTTIVSQTLGGLLNSGVAVGEGDELELESVTYQNQEIDPYNVHLFWISEDEESDFETVTDLMSYMESGDPIDPDDDQEMSFYAAGID